MIGLVKLIARHSAMKLAKTWYFTAYLVLKDASSLKTVCARTVRLSVPVIYFGYRAGIHSDLALYSIKYFNYLN
jgi:hypothetical protein